MTTLGDFTTTICQHCSDPLDDQDPAAGGIVLSRLEPGFAHFMCEWEALLDAAEWRNALVLVSGRDRPREAAA